MNFLEAIYTARNLARLAKDKDKLNVLSFVIGELERHDKKKITDALAVQVINQVIGAEKEMLPYHPNSCAYNIEGLTELLALAPPPPPQANVDQMLELVASASNIRELMANAKAFEIKTNCVVDKSWLKELFEVNK